MTGSLRLSDHDMSPERGFLCAYDAADVTLPPELAPAEAAAKDMPRTLLTGRVRRHLEGMPVLDLKAFCAEASDAQLRTAMVRYSFMVQAYVWGEPEAPTA
ncbi:MAG: indoleamine 2,3-dioxygenase, partial [Alphaproteobacteria bacterium]